jgi:hypothetical protein
MGLIGWIVLGFLAGFLAGQLVNRRREGLSLDVLRGLVGARGWRPALPRGWSYWCDGPQCLESDRPRRRSGALSGGLACSARPDLARLGYATLSRPLPGTRSTSLAYLLAVTRDGRGHQG